MMSGVPKAGAWHARAALTMGKLDWEDGKVRWDEGGGGG